MIGLLCRSAIVAALALACSFAIIAASGHSSVEAARAMWEGAFGSPRQLGGTLQETLLLTLLALGWCVAFRARKVNVGLEGQALIGGMVAAIVALELGGPAPVLLPLAALAGVLGGAAYAGVAALLWARRGVNEIISTLMLNLVAVQLLAWLVRGPLHDPQTTFAQTAPLPDAARWNILWPGTPLTWAVLLGPIVVLAVWIGLERTTFGFALRLTGANRHAARAAGIGTERIGALSLVASGALAGLAGSCIVLAGQSTVMTDNFTAARGFEGIAVALLAANHPAGVPIAALLFASLQEGGGLMEARVGVPSSLVLITQGLVIALVAAAPAVALRRRRSARAPATEPSAAQPAPAVDSGGPR